MVLNSGYSEEQTKKILKNGNKGYIGRMRSREKLGRKLRSTAEESRKSRYLGKLLSKKKERGKSMRKWSLAKANHQEMEPGSAEKSRRSRSTGL